MAAHYYNEFNIESAAMLSQMMRDGLLAKGDIDTRSISEVEPKDLQGYKQCHFFAGIGGWAYALQLADWPKDKPVWTGSCPCQPFSSNGKHKGKDDERHLWPVWEELIRQCRPTTVFGEQVASAVAHGWLDDVYKGLEAEGYAVGAAVLPACSVGAPMRRDRLWFVATTSDTSDRVDETCRTQRTVRHMENSRWQNVEWHESSDGRKFCLERGLPLLAHGVFKRSGPIRAFGNAIVPQVAAEFIRASFPTTGEALEDRG